MLRAGARATAARVTHAFSESILPASASATARDRTARSPSTDDEMQLCGRGDKRTWRGKVGPWR